MATKTATKDEREHQRRRALEQLEQATAALLTTDGWRAWLRVRATLHSYSARNVLLLAAQAQERGIELSYVAGFRAWLRLGRCVRKGETALKVFAPLPPRQQGDTARERDGARDDAVCDDEADRPRLRFRLASVFDVSQTDPLPDGDPIPLQPPARAPIAGDSHAHLLTRLEAFAARHGYPVERVDDLGGAEGLCSHRERRIRLVGHHAANHQLAVLIHELAHALQGPQPRERYAANEVIVETVAFLVTYAAGLDTSSASVPYIAGWAQQQDDPMEAVRRTLAEIDWLANRLQTALDGDDTEPHSAAISVQAA